MSEYKVYHVGYNAYNSEQHVQALMGNPRMLLIDTRKTPWSYKPQWSRDDKHVGSCTVPGLASQWGRRYRYAGKVLGNENYKHPELPIKIINLDEGLRGLKLYLQKGYSLILLCGCTHDGCHRYTIMRELQRAIPEVQFYRADGTPEQMLDSSPTAPEKPYKCLSIRPPYAQWIAQYDQFVAAGIPPKTIENREWTTRYRGPVLLHASKTFEEDAIWHWERRIPGLGKVVPLYKEGYECGAIVGIADLVDVVEESDDPWFCGSYGWVFANARPLKTPIPWRGSLKLFDVPASAVPELVEVVA